MRRLLSILILLALPILILLALALPASGANYTVIASGPWSTTTTWSAASNYLCPGIGQTGGTFSGGTNGQLTLSMNYGVAKTPAWATGDPAYITGATGTANGDWVVSATGGTNGDVLTLSSAYVHTWTSGGSVTRSNNGGGTATVSGTASNSGSAGGPIKITTTAAPSAGAGWNIGDLISISGVGGTTEANGSWVVTAVPSGTSIVINPVYDNTSTGGTVYRGDTFYDGAGNHTLTLDTNVYLGKRWGSTNYFMYGGGTLTINNNKVLRLSGTILNYASTITLSSGSVIEFVDGFANNNATCTLATSTSVGGSASAPSAGSRALVRTAAGGTGNYIALTSAGTSGTPLSYVTFTGIAATGSNNVFSGSPTTINLDHVIFDGCGQIQLGTPGATGTCSLSYCTIKNSTATYGMSMTASVLKTGGTRQFTNCYFGSRVSWSSYGIPGFTVTGCVFADSWQMNGASPTGAAASFTNNLNVFQNSTNVGYIGLGDMTDCYHIITEQGPNNAFFVQCPNTFGITALRNTFDAPFIIQSSSNSSDCFYQYDNTSGQGNNTHKIRYSISLPVTIGYAFDANGAYAAKGTSSGAIQSGATLASGRVKVQVEHNTVCSRTRCAGGFVAGSGFGPFLNDFATPSNQSAANSCTMLANNLFWDDATPSSGNYGYSSITSGSPPATFTSSPAIVTDLITPSGVYNNAFYGMTKPADSNLVGTLAYGTYYNLKTSTTPGLNDITMSNIPGFVDPSRCFLTWAAMLQGKTLTYGSGNNSATILTAAIAVFQAMNDDTGADTRYTPANLNAWVRAGFAPTNPELRYAASDGTAAGAVPFNTNPQYRDLYRRNKARGK